MIQGTVDKGIVEVTNAFTVPHNESEDEVVHLFDLTGYIYFHVLFIFVSVLKYVFNMNGVLDRGIISPELTAALNSFY